jgi:AcrR family transcriptional regulator
MERMGYHGWQGNPPGTQDEARRRIVEAATACIDRVGLAKTSFSDVAAEAGVTRQTVYRYFPSLADVLRAVAMAGVEEYAGRMERHLATFGSAAEVAVESVVFGVRAVPDDPHLGLLLDDIIEDSRWDVSRPAGERRGIFVGTSNFASHYFNHTAALLALRDISEETAEPVTVVCTDGAQADLTATALWLLGGERGEALFRTLSDHPLFESFEVVFVYNDGTVFVSDGLLDRFQLTGEGYTLREAP